MSVEAKTEYIPGDPILIRDIISQLKSQGVFDQFRKECISDVDTKPAYQNLCHRVDGQVSSYLSDIRWGPELNKNQLRENIRKFVNKCTFVEPGISRIVDQLVNPRINTVLVPKVEDIVYQYVGIPPIERRLPNESSHNSNGNHKFDNHDSSFEKSWSSSSSYKRNHENEPSWLRSPSKKFDNYVHSKMDSSSSLPSLFDLKVEPPDEMKEKNEDSRTDFFHSEAGEDDNSRAYSAIDSDEDNLNDDVEEPSPSFEAFDIPDTCNSPSADSDYPTEIANLKDDCPPGLDVDEKSTPSNVERTDENTNADSLDDRSSQIDTKVFEEVAPAQFEVPKTPTINYETSEDSDDNNCLKVNDTLKEGSMNQEHRSLAEDIPDFSSVDKIAQKIAEENRDHEKIVSCDDEVGLKTGDCDRQKIVVELTPKSKEDKTDKHHKDGEKESKAADSGAKDSKHRDRKDKHKLDKRDSSRDDRERKHREKERSNHDSSRSKSSKTRTESRDKTRKSSDEKEPAEDETSSKSKSKDDHKSHRSHDDRKSRDKDEKKQKSSSSGERRSKDDKSKEKRSRSGDGKEDRKKSRHDRDRSKDLKKISQEEEKVKIKKPDGTETKDAKKNSQEEEKIKLKKPDSAESKKSGKSQCGTDEKKARTNRRSSDRDSNGPSSSSNHSHHRSTSKSDKEKHSEKSRHSSSLSSTSHKSKKSDNSKSVSSDRHSEDGCDNSNVTTHHKELAHQEKKKEEKGSSRSTCDRRDVEQIPKDLLAVSGLDSKGQEDAKHKEQSHHEKKNEEKVFSRATCDHRDAEPQPRKPSAASDLDSKIQEEAKVSKISTRPSPPKRSLLEMNSKEETTISNDLPGDGQNSPMKTSENDFSAFNIKKPKIARNEFEFGKVVRLRKEYKEKMRLLQQQGKENNSESCEENEEKRIMERLSPAPTLKESKVVSNGSKNGLVKDLKLNITRIDACYRIVDGSCFVKEASSRDDDVSPVETPLVFPETDTKTLKLNIKPVSDEKQDKLIKLKICRSISPTSGKERTKCVRSSTYENEDTKSNPTREVEEIKPHPVAENEEIATNLVSATANEAEPVFYPPSENEDDLEEELLNEDLLRQMNIEEIIGCRTDCTRISYDSCLNSEKNVSEVIEAVKDHLVDKNVVLFDEDNKENVGTETQCVNDVATNRVPKKSSPEVLYFEPSSPTNDFTNFVERLIRESEDVTLPNFSILLDYPKEYDVIFRSQLGASVNRVIKVEHFSSGNLDDASTVSSSVADTLPKVEEETMLSGTPANELKPIIEFNSILNLAPESKCDSSHDNQHVAPVQKVKITNATKRKTLGIKRRISSISGSTACRTLNASSDLPTESLVVSRVSHPASPVAGNNAKKKLTEISATLPTETSSCLNTYTHEFLSLPEITLPRLPVPVEEDERKRIYSSFNNNVSESSSYPIPAKTPKKPRKNSPIRSSNEILTEIVPKRTPYKNKCYYDNSDLYKPRPSFLASSRRSRALNPDSK